MRKLFIDVDGVLFADYAGTFQLRPRVMSFLYWAKQNFECYFLTAWEEPEILKLMELMYMDPNAISYADWDTEKWRGVNKLCPQGDFFWMEDGWERRDHQWLINTGFDKRCVRVSPEGEFGLDDAVKKLATLAGIDEPEYLKSSGKRLGEQLLEGIFDDDLGEDLLGGIFGDDEDDE